MEDCLLRWKEKMSLALDDIRDFRVLTSEIEKKLDINIPIYFVNDDINSLMYIKMGFKNELNSSLYVYEPEYKWCGFYKEPLLIVQDIDYYKKAYDYTHPEYPMFDIIDMYIDSYKRIFYIISYPTRKKYYQTIKNYKKLQPRYQNILINIKTNKCSCHSYKKFNKCRHQYLAKDERDRIKILFGLVLRRFISWTIAKNIFMIVNLF